MEHTTVNFASQRNDEQIDIRQYFGVVNRYKWGILGLAFAITLAAFFYVSSLVSIYTASTTLLIEQKQPKVIASINDFGDVDSGAKEYLQTQFEILKSRELATRVFNELNIVSHPEYMLTQQKQADEKSWLESVIDWRAFLPKGHSQNPVVTVDVRLMAQIDKFANAIKIEPIRQTQLVKISFESSDPKLAADVPNALARAYINSQMEARVTTTEQAANWLASRLGVLKSNLEVSAKNLQDFREQNNLIESENGSILAFTADQIQQIGQRVLDAQFKVTDLSKRYGPKHPALIEAQLELEEAQKALTNAKSDALDVGKKEFRLQELEREVETNRNLYDTFFTRIKEANESLQLEVTNARVVDPAIIPITPFKPRKSLITALSLVMSLVMGTLLAFLLDYLDTTFRSIDDVEQKLGLAMLGMVPLVTTKKGEKASIYFLDSKQHSYSEAMRTVRTSVILSGIDQPHRIVLITSSVPSEGKTTSALNLAVALGQMERVLLIDADMRRPSIGKVLGISGSSPGLANVVAGTIELEDCLHHLEEANIDVLTAGLIPPNPLELLSSRRFADLLELFKQKYDRIIIDSPPSLLVSDALVLSKLANAVLYVVRADTTAHHTARAGIDRLRAANAPLIGVLLNKVNMRKASKYYGSYSGYYNYNYYTYGYGYTQRADEK